MALTSIGGGVLAAIAAVRVEFGRILTLGTAVGNVAFNMAEEFVVPQLEELLPAEYEQWAAPTIKYAINFVVLVLSYCLFRILAVLHATLRGSQMAAHGLLRYLVRNNMAPQLVDSMKKAQSGVVFDGVVAAIALLGFVFQWYFEFDLPFPLNWLLMPLTIVEYIVSGVIWWL